MPRELVQNVNHASQIPERLLDPVAKAAKGKSAALAGAVLLLTDKYGTSALYFALAYRYRSSLLFGESRAGNLALAKAFGVKKYPLLLLFVPTGRGTERYSDDWDTIRYDGDLKADAIGRWLDKSLKDGEAKRRNEYGL
jgi:hypothetical protein